jgi:hypothetical protein
MRIVAMTLSAVAVAMALSGCAYDRYDRYGYYGNDGYRDGNGSNRYNDGDRYRNRYNDRDRYDRDRDGYRD